MTDTMTASPLQQAFPWVESPAIFSAPMAGAASPALAAEVTKASGFGFLGATVDVSPGSSELAALDAGLQTARDRLAPEATSDGRLRIGLAFITGHKSITRFSEGALPIIAKHSPAAVWLFAPDGDVNPHPAIIAALRGLEKPPVVFVQVGNVAAAREAVRDGADVLVCQGVDAGGHQFRQGTGIISFVPEVTDMLRAEFEDREIIVLAAGGIADGRGVAAALSLGAQGIVMGTRFAATPESSYPEFRKELIVQAADGGQSTLKSPFNDQINESTLWGPLYDGRAIVSPIHKEFLAGASLEECLKMAKEQYTEDEAKRHTRTWAGAGVGLINKIQPAGEIVDQVREEAKAAIQRVAGLV